MRVTDVVPLFVDDIVGGGVSPSSDFISCMENDNRVGSSAISRSELPDGLPSLSSFCDQTCLRWSRSGGLLEGELMVDRPNGDCPHGVVSVVGGVFGASGFATELEAGCATLGRSMSGGGDRLTGFSSDWGSCSGLGAAGFRHEGSSTPFERVPNKDPRPG